MKANGLRQLQLNSCHVKERGQTDLGSLGPNWMLLGSAYGQEVRSSGTNMAAPSITMWQSQGRRVPPKLESLLPEN